MCFGLSAASCKTGITMVARVGWLAFPLGLAGSVLMSSLGFMLQTLGLKDGNTVIVCTCAAVSSMATGNLPIFAPLLLPFIPKECNTIKVCCCAMTSPSRFVFLTSSQFSPSPLMVAQSTGKMGLMSSHVCRLKSESVSNLPNA